MHPPMRIAGSNSMKLLYLHDHYNSKGLQCVFLYSIPRSSSVQPIQHQSLGTESFLRSFPNLISCFSHFLHCCWTPSPMHFKVFVLFDTRFASTLKSFQFSWSAWVLLIQDPQGPQARQDPKATGQVRLSKLPLSPKCIPSCTHAA